MKLILDFGNTLKKVAFFQKGKMKELFIHEDLSVDDLRNYAEKYPFDASILSSVVEYPGEIREFLSERSTFIELSDRTPLPIKIDYRTPKTLGRDRIAAAVAGNNIYPSQDVLVVTAGTCIIYDLITSNNTYRGGGISPGIDMRYKSLHTFTDHLPLIEKSGAVKLTGRSTRGSIISGVHMGAIAEVDGIIDRYKRIYENLTVILSGGDVKYFDKKLKNNIFAVPNIVLKGLNIILDFNVQHQGKA